MGPRFKHYNYDQDAMVVINYQEQLQPGTFEYAVHYLIAHKLDLSVFHPKHAFRCAFPSSVGFLDNA
ncbi:MAG: hypothetical protein ACTHYN_12925 [Marinobacter sp.]|uniref:hypothetical protein n=1 Tax=Marinobacter sp. TaxID=50741 RepID=UPI003F9A9CB9